MNHTALVNDILAKAKDCGFSDCGIIPVGDMAGYADMLDKHFARFPDQAEYGQKYYDFAFPTRQYPWAKSVIICTRHYGKYRIPETLEGKIGKFYLTNSYNPEAREYKDTLRFNAYIEDRFGQSATDQENGIIAYRWAAMQAGLGIIRKNNFLYTEKGSWFRMEAWLIDEELEHKLQKDLRPCPEKCDLCVQSCPTNALAEPYMTRRTHCIEYLTAKVKDDNDFVGHPLSGKTNTWLYGCDACQDACPMNRNKWEGTDEFPALESFADAISPIKILYMDADYMENTLQPKFWELAKDDSWKWKVNALNYMRNHYEPQYNVHIQAAMQDPDNRVRDMAAYVTAQL